LDIENWKEKWHNSRLKVPGHKNSEYVVYATPQVHRASWHSHIDGDRGTNACVDIFPHLTRYSMMAVKQQVVTSWLLNKNRNHRRDLLLPGDTNTTQPQPSIHIIGG
jgi:hypothetical protein